MTLMLFHVNLRIFINQIANSLTSLFDFVFEFNDDVYIAATLELAGLNHYVVQF